jgi:hypothetical protein
MSSRSHRRPCHSLPMPTARIRQLVVHKRHSSSSDIAFLQEDLSDCVDSNTLIVRRMLEMLLKHIVVLFVFLSRLQLMKLFIKMM